MKTLRQTILFLALLLPATLLQAQTPDYLGDCRKALDEGKCKKAETLYKLAHKKDKEIERRIAECKGGSSGQENRGETSLVGDANGHEWVDLGLPSGTLWATCNVGASKPEGYGNYYAWGETSTKRTYNWESYGYVQGTTLEDPRLTKYCNKSHFGNNGFTDNLTELQGSDDPATAWGSGWRTPSKAQWEELMDNTTHKWTTQNGTNGRLFTSEKNGQTLFLPAAGGRWDSEFRKTGSYGFYWSRSLVTDVPSIAYFLDFYPTECYMFCGSRDTGLSVRPVTLKSKG